MIALRDGIDPEARGHAAAAVARLGTAFLAEAGCLAGGSRSAISGFLSIGGELDTAPVLAALHQEGYRLCLPVMQGRGKPLLFRAWQPADAMRTTLWGIREPEDHQPTVIPHVLLVPLLAVDRAGWRLGYGGGFYDRTLRMLRANGPALAVGLCFDEQVVDVVPHLDYDERIDWILTPSGARKCTE